MKIHSLLASLAAIATIPLSAQNLLFIGGQAGPTQGADPAVFAFLEERYGVGSVTYQQAGATASGDENAFDAFIISSTPGSGDMRGKFQDSTTPTLNWEEATADNGAGEYRITAGRTKDNVATDHVISINEAHPITNGFDVGAEVTISTGQTEVWWSTGQQAPGSLSLASELEDPSRLFLTIVAVVRFRRSSDLVQLGADVAIDMVQIDTDWKSISIDVVPEAIGETIVIEWNFTSDDSGDAFSGLSIDNIEVAD